MWWLCYEWMNAMVLYDVRTHDQWQINGYFVAQKAEMQLYIEEQIANKPEKGSQKTISKISTTKNNFPRAFP